MKTLIATCSASYANVPMVSPVCPSNDNYVPTPMLSSLLLGCFSSSTNIHQLAIHTESAHHYIQYDLGTLRFLQSTAATSKHQNDIWKGATSHIKVTRPPCLFQLPPWENVNRSTTLIYSTWVMSCHYLFMSTISLTTCLLPQYLNPLYKHMP